MSSKKDVEQLLVVKIRQDVKAVDQPVPTGNPNPARDKIRIVLDKASKVTEDNSLKRPRGCTTPTDQLKISESSQNKKAHISPIRAPVSSPNPTTFQSTVHGTPQPIRALANQYFLGSQQHLPPQEAPPRVSVQPTPFQALSLPYFVQQPTTPYQNNVAQNCHFQNDQTRPNLLNLSPSNNPEWPVGQQPSSRCNITDNFAPVGANQIASVKNRIPQPPKIVPSPAKNKLQVVAF
jgi:hypothetical protein